MEYVTHTRASNGLADRFASFFSSLTERYSKYRVYRTTLNELQQLSSRELNDLGLNQSNIKRVALEAAYDK